MSAGRAADLLTAGSVIAAVGFLFWRFGRRRPVPADAPKQPPDSDFRKDDDASQSPD